MFFFKLFLWQRIHHALRPVAGRPLSQTTRHRWQTCHLQSNRYFSPKRQQTQSPVVVVFFSIILSFLSLSLFLFLFPQFFLSYCSHNLYWTLCCVGTCSETAENSQNWLVWPALGPCKRWLIDCHMGWSSKLGATMGGGGVNPGVGLLIPGSHPVDRVVKAP